MEWKREGRTVYAVDSENWQGWSATVIPGHRVIPIKELESIARLMHAAPKLQDMVTDLIAWLEPWARLDTGEKYREAITAARKLLREIEGDAS
jgi:hypothetical protein